MDEYTVHIIQVTQVYFADAVTVWDWIVSLPKEYKRIWQAPWSLIKVLYLANRYYTIGNLAVTLYGFNSKMTAEECEHFHRWEPGLALGTTLLCEAILVIRTYALWGRNKSVLALLATCFVAEACILFYAVFKFLPVPTQDPSNPASRGACIAGGGPGGRDWTMAYWVSPVAMDTIMLVLTTIRALQYRKRGVKSTVFQTFVRDGIVYFFVVAAVNLINTAFYCLPSQALQAVNSPMSLLMTSIMCSRIVLSLRGEEKNAIENVSKDWQINTFLRKRQASSSGGTPGKSRGVVSNAIPATHDIHLGDISHTYDQAVAEGSLPYSNPPVAVACGRGPHVRGVRVQVETGVVVDQEKRGQFEDWHSDDKV